MGIANDREKKLDQIGVSQYLASGDVEQTLALVLEHGINPYSVHAVQMKGMMKMRKGLHAEAEGIINTALSMRSDHIGWKMRGDTAFLQHRFAEAETHYKKALSIRPDTPEILHDLGVAVVSQGRVDECIEWFEKAIALSPDRADFHHHMSLMMILAGRDKDGWERMKWRLQVPGVCGTFPYPEKYWKGEDLAGKVLVVRSEQGWGDTILFTRYFPWLAARAAKVYFYGQRAMLPLIEKYYPSIVCWPNDAPTPIDFDYHVNLMCLPRLVGEEMPAPAVREGNGEGLGVCWFGSATHKADHLRSVPVEMFARFADVMDAKLYSLGYGYFWKLENGIPIGENKPDFIEYCITEKHDWLQTAEFVQGLDLIITVDTAIAHLGGFLGVDTWLLLPYVPDFRWGMKGETTKWYPSMKLYRQKELMNWNEVFERVESDLAKRIAKT